MPVVLLACLALGSLSRAAEFKSSEGFSLKYPEGWTVLSEEARDSLAEAAEALSGVSSGPANCAVMIFNSEFGMGGENMNVVVVPGRLRIDAEAERQFSAKVREEYSAIGVVPDIVECRRTTIGGRDVLSIRYDATMPMAPDTLRQWQVAFPGSSKTFILTCTAQKSKFDQLEPLFSATVNSFKVEESFWSKLPGPIRYGILGGLIGGLVGGLISAVRALAKKKTPATPDPGQGFGPPQEGAST
jgi:hypothetical protein